MFKDAKPLSIIVETPLHAGSGSELGVVDLPIQRERHTGYPKVEASSLKGCLREAFEGQYSHFPDLDSLYAQLYIEPVFGPEQGDAHASALGLTDARLLLFPVKSMKGVFAWITCPAVLDRLKQDLGMAGLPTPNIDSAALVNTVPNGSGLFIKDTTIVLEEYAFNNVQTSDACTTLSEWLVDNLLPAGPGMAFWRDKLARDVLVLNNDDFCDFVTMSTEVIARTKIDDKTGTVAQGALWYEEYLPADSVLYTLALARDPLSEHKQEIDSAKKVMEFFVGGLERARHIFQLGGNATIGKGLLRIHPMPVTTTQEA